MGTFTSTRSNMVRVCVRACMCVCVLPLSFLYVQLMQLTLAPKKHIHCLFASVCIFRWHASIVNMSETYCTPNFATHTRIPTHPPFYAHTGFAMDGINENGVSVASFTSEIVLHTTEKPASSPHSPTPIHTHTHPPTRTHSLTHPHPHTPIYTHTGFAMDGMNEKGVSVASFTSEVIFHMTEKPAPPPTITPPPAAESDAAATPAGTEAGVCLCVCLMV